MSTVRQLLSECKQIDRLDAEVLLGEALSEGRAWLYAHDDAEPNIDQTAKFQAWVARRRAGEPVAYLTGWRDFWSLRLSVSSATLIPRPETELLVEQALARLPESSPNTVLDLGTGSGAIALAIAKERPLAVITATDNSPHALAVAKDNALRLGLERVNFLNGNWYQPLATQQFNMIVSNPPYVAAVDPHLDRGDASHEPRSALTPGGDGLGACAAIINGAAAHLEAKGYLLLEHGYDQRAPLLQMLNTAGLELIEACDDLAGNPRLLISRAA